MTPSDSVNTGKGVESQYQYHGPVEGQQESIPLTGVPDSGSPMIMKDQIIQANHLDADNKKIIAPPIDNPNAPIPTRKAVKSMAVRKAIQEETIKEAANKLAGGGDGGNDWLKFPNSIGKLNIALIELQNNMSKTRFQEAKMKMQIEAEMFKLGMENAEFAKMLKDTAAQKELIKAVSSFVQAATHLYQIGNLAQERGRVQEQVFGKDNNKIVNFDDDSFKNSVEFQNLPQASKDIKIQEREIRKLENSEGIKVTDKAAQNKKELDDLVKNKPEVHKQIEEQKKKLQTMQEKQWRDFNDEYQKSTSINENKSRLLLGVTEGIVGVVSSFYTQHEGQLEKLRAINETLQQFWSKLDDSISKSKDDSAQLIDKIMQTMIQLNSEMKATLSTRG